MARTTQDRHPAVGLARMEEMATASLPGWETFTPLQRRFLLLAGYMETEAEVLREMGLKANRVEVWKHKFPLFREAVKRRKEQAVLVVQRYGEHLLAQAMEKLELMVLGDDNPKMQLEAIRTLFKMTGVLREGGVTQVKAQVDVRNTQLFSGFQPASRSRSPRSKMEVEGEVGGEVIEDFQGFASGGLDRGAEGPEGSQRDGPGDDI